MTGADSLAALDAAWAEQVLRDSGHADGAVTGLEVEAVPFTGATTDMARLRLTYAEAEVARLRAHRKATA